MNLRIELYNERYFDQLCQVMDKARMQELKTANIERVFFAVEGCTIFRLFVKLQNLCSH